MRVCVATAAVLGLAAQVAAVDPLVIRGSKFFNEKTGSQFFFKGVAYQPRTGVTDANPDPLADPVACKRDVAVFNDLGLNAVRVYEVDYANSHDECMNMFDSAGIYVMLDMPSPKYSINRVDPHWDDSMMREWRAKVDAFSGYPNLVAWIAGNEVANNVNTTSAAAFVKAAIRDMKAYLRSKGLKTPVGYADNDDPDIRMNLINYFNCGDDDTRADLYGINTYRWCGSQSTFKTSGYEDITNNMTDYTVPSLLTEYGCNKVRPRTFTEVGSLYGPDMTGVFSGGFMYEYSEEDSDYGIVKVSHGSSSVEKTQDYSAFKKALQGVKPQGVKMSSYKPGGKPSTCPAASSVWHVKSDVLPPTPSTARCQCMIDSLGCTFKSANLTASEGNEVGTVVGGICGQTSCADISVNPAEGVYGDYSACDAYQRAAWAINKNYENQRGAVCTAGDVATKIVSSPKVADTSKCLTAKDDIGNAGAPHQSGSSSGGGGGSSADNRETDGQSSAAAALAVHASSAFAATIAAVAAAAAFYAI